MPHLIYLAIGFPPASKSCAYRMKAMANAFAQSGWGVTAVSLADSSWEIDNGTDQSLLVGLNPAIERAPVNLRREDFEPIIGRWTPLHARNPDRWKAQFLKRSTRDFPEKIFGAWRTPLIEAVSAVYRTKPADLLIVSPAPYTTLAVADAVHKEFAVPYIVDYRDGWSVDVVNGGSAFEVGSKQDRIEREVLKNASAAWFVNEPIMEFYKDRYPESSTKFSVVRNGYDASAVAEITPDIPAPSPLSFGYLGTLNLTIPALKNLLEGWRVARESVPGLRDSTFEFRGHVGAGYASGAGGHARLISEYEGYGVSYGGAVAKADVAAVYSRWNALVLALIGGEYVTSGKVYEYMATGLPILSVHEANHAACDVLDGYPPWALAEPSSPEAVAAGFTLISQVAEGYDEISRRKALDHANSFEYKRSMSSVVDHASALARPPAEFTNQANGSQANGNQVLLQPHRDVEIPAKPVVTLIAAQRIVATTLEKNIPVLLAAGCTVRLITLHDPRSSLDAIDLVHQRLTLQAFKRGRSKATRAIKRNLLAPFSSLVMKALKLPQRADLLIRMDPTLDEWIATTDVFVALDRYAAYAAKNCSQRAGHAVAILGMREITRLVTSSTQQG